MSEPMLVGDGRLAFAPDGLAPAEGRLLTFDNRSPDLFLGWDGNPHNNVWGTNFAMWLGVDARFRFRFTGRVTTQRRMPGPCTRQPWRQWLRRHPPHV